MRSLKQEKDPPAALVSSLDNLFHLRRELASLIEPKDLARLPREGKAGGALMDLPSHAVVQGGRIVGLWEYDAEKGELVAGLFAKATPAVKKAVRAMEAFVRDQLGDARSFSLDSPESRGERIAGLRRLSA